MSSAENDKSTVADIKQAIRKLTLIGMSAREIEHELKKDGYREITLITVTSIRAQTIEVLRYLTDEGLINERALERRRQKKAAQVLMKGN